MPRITILTETDLRTLVPLDLAAIDCIEAAFAALATGKVVMPPILSMAIADNNGEVDVKTAYVTGTDSFAIKMSPGFYDNPKFGLASTSGLMVLFSAKTGMLQALLLENGYLTDLRTAAAGAIAARHLSRPDARKACIIGAGAQAHLQLKALQLVRQITEAEVWARDTAKAEAAAATMTAELGIPVRATADRKAAVVAADIIVMTTPSADPLVMADWLQPGQHVTAMGSDQDYKGELDPNCLSRADLYVPDRQTQTEELGELRNALAAGTIGAKSQFPELGEIVAGAAPGRRTNTDITICDLTGTGAQDTAIAIFARQLAENAGIGHVIES